MVPAGVVVGGHQDSVGGSGFLLHGLFPPFSLLLSLAHQRFYRTPAVLSGGGGHQAVITVNNCLIQFGDKRVSEHSLCE